MRLSLVVMRQLVLLGLMPCVLTACPSHAGHPRHAKRARDAGVLATHAPARAPSPAGLPKPAPAAPPISKDALACRSFSGGVPADLVRINLVCERACKQGDMPSCGLVASNLQLGLGVRRDVPRAAALYRRVCDSGKAPTACWELGTILDAGKGLPRDHAAALAAWRKGCKQGSQMSCQYAQGVRYVPKRIELVVDGGVRDR